MTRLACRLLLAAALAPLGVAAQSNYVPGDSWETVSPGALGWDEGALSDLIQWLGDEDSRAFLVLKDGRIAVEAYFHGHARDDEWVWYSAGKSLTSVLVEMARADGLISLDEPVSTYLGRWTGMSREREDSILVRHNLTMTSGIDESVAFGCTLRICMPYRAPAGTRWVYHNAPYNVLRPLLETVTGSDLGAFTNERLAGIGFSGRWDGVGDNNFFHSTPRTAARFGLLVSRFGRWGDEVVLDSASVQEMLAPSQDLNPSYGRLWWLNGQDTHILPGDTVQTAGSIAPHAPRDVVTAAGSQGQFISIAGSLNLVVVRMGRGDADLVPTHFLDELWMRLLAVTGTGTAVREWPSTPAVEVFPVPAGRFVEIRVPELPAAGIEVTDLLGRTTGVSGVLEAGRLRLDVSGLASGVYLLRLTGTAGPAAVRTIVVR